MNITHIALWSPDIERLKEFYTRWFNAAAGQRYHNPATGLTTYFLTFPSGGPALELMNIPGLTVRPEGALQGFCHIAVSVGSREEVDRLTERMRSAGVTVVGNPRVTGDGMYESVVADPDGNLIELTP